MKIKEYLSKYYPGVLYKKHDLYNHLISNCVNNSKKASKNCVYVHFKDNSCYEYIDEAISLGAKTIIVSKDCFYETKKNVNIIKVDIPKVDLARLNYEMYVNKYSSFPTLIGVTGTTGKTSTVSLLFCVLKQLNKDVLLISSNGIYSYYAKTLKEYPTNNTTPSNSLIYEYMSMNELAYDYVIIEVSSQGLVDLRLLGLRFDYSLVTNFKNEHAEYHQNEDNYLNAKKMLVYNTNKHLIINNEIKCLNSFLACNIIPYTTFGIDSGHVSAKILESNLEHNYFVLNCLGTKYLIDSNLVGSFNIYNIISVFILLKTLGFEEKVILNELSLVKQIEGRMNVFTYRNRKVIVDYAHSKLAIEKLFSFLNTLKYNKLICVIGAGGLRDNDYRKYIGTFVLKRCDLVILTEDNSRSEKVEDIINDIVNYASSNNYLVEYNRQKAIDLSFEKSNKDDLIVIIGKGNEDYIIREEEIPFNDVKYIKSLGESNG